MFMPLPPRTSELFPRLCPFFLFCVVGEADGDDSERDDVWCRSRDLTPSRSSVADEPDLVLLFFFEDLLPLLPPLPLSVRRRALPSLSLPSRSCLGVLLLPRDFSFLEEDLARLPSVLVSLGSADLARPEVRLLPTWLPEDFRVTLLFFSDTSSADCSQERSSLMSISSSAARRSFITSRSANVVSTQLSVKSVSFSKSVVLSSEARICERSSWSQISAISFSRPMMVTKSGLSTGFVCQQSWMRLSMAAGTYSGIVGL
mmetsp:Transcript_15519/g.60703  ORF Transcript_15519/g.60703 Transcript_15519/m.60703 type:complete len:259 (-) Transcript_15519:1031-1807(-)